MGVYIKVVLIILGFVAILYAASVTTRFVGSKYGSMVHGKYIKILDKLMLARDRWVYIVQIGERFFFIGVAANDIELLGELKHEDLIPIVDEQKNSFADLFSKYRGSSYFKKDSGEDKYGK